jgi:hypothetical protein
VTAELPAVEPQATAAPERQLGTGRTTSADCTCPIGPTGFRRGISLTCPWDGVHPNEFARKKP